VPPRITQFVLKFLDKLALLCGKPNHLPAHQQTGRRGEEDAYFHLRRLGYTIVARNFRSPRRHGEIDLVAWDGDDLCFIEVKTRTSHAVKPAEAAVDHAKQRELAAMAHEYQRQARISASHRFEILSIYYEGLAAPKFELFKNTRPMS
jgi:putative endonuclease